MSTKSRKGKKTFKYVETNHYGYIHGEFRGVNMSKHLFRKFYLPNVINLEFCFRYRKYGSTI